MSTEEALFGIRHNEAANNLWQSEQMFRWSFMLRPKLSIDGNQWCALLGENIQDGVAGFGDSPDAAYAAFDVAWTEKLAGATLPATAYNQAEANPVTSSTLAEFLHENQPLMLGGRSQPLSVYLEFARLVLSEFNMRRKPPLADATTVSRPMRATTENVEENK